MIKSLQIKNYAIIEDLEMRFADGLTIITGETGAGKSILVGALGLIMGNRADTKALYDTARKCVVEGIFDVSKYDLKEFFDQSDIDYEEECAVRRELTPFGKSRAFVNDTPVNLNQLRQLSGALIDLHQQFDTLDIHRISFQLRMIDALAANHDLLSRYQLLFQNYKSNQRRLDAMIRQNEKAASEMDFINFQLEEFNEAALVEGELEQLESDQKRLNNAENIKRTLSEAFRALSENDPSVLGQLEELVHSVGDVKTFHPNLEALYRRFQGLLFEIQDLAQDFEKVAGQTEYDEERISEIQQRLDSIYRLQNKHRVGTVAELLNIRENLQSQLDAFGDLSSEIEALEARLHEQEENLTQMASELSERRRSVVSGFEQKVMKLLARLVMPFAKFKVEIDQLEEFSPTGLDEVNFFFTANKGTRLQLIKDVASGGELSRLNLVTKSLVASAIPLPTLIFDEIDSGVSGDVALKTGTILRKLSNQHQVVSITHSPQIAAKADAHYFVYKKEKAERSITKVKLLSENDRVRAIATMLSQSPPSEAALENARELLGIQIVPTGTK